MPLPGARPGRRFTYGDYLTSPDGPRWELLEGEPAAMGPGPDRRHQKLLLGLAVVFLTCLKGRACRVYPAPFDVRLPRGGGPDEEVDTVVRPDLLVLGVTSPATASRDHIGKKSLYERHGVRE